MIQEVVELMLRKDVGVIQLPCPETSFMGLRRFWQSVEQYRSAGFRKHCRRLAEKIVDLIEEYVRNDYEVLGVIGIAGSPSCGIYEVSSNPEWLGNPRAVISDTRRVKGPGVFMEELFKMLSSRGIRISGVDYDHRDSEGSLKRILEMIRGD